MVRDLGWPALAALACGAACHASPRLTEPAPGDPIAGLAVAWQVRGASPLVVLPLAPAAPVLAAGGVIGPLDARDGYRLPGAAIADIVAAVLVGDRLIVAGRQRLVALAWPPPLDARPREAWKLELPGEDTVGPIAGGGRSGRIYADLVRPEATPSAHDLVALRTASGGEVWRARLPAGWTPIAMHSARGDHVVIVIARPGDDASPDPETGPLRVLAYAADSGRPAWHYDAADAHDAAIGEDRAVVARAGAVAILELATGRVREVVVPAAAAPLVAIAPDDDAVYVTGPRGSDGGDGGDGDGGARGTIVAIGLADGRVRWTTPTAWLPTRIAAGAGGVYALSAGGVAHGFDRGDGAARWAWGLGHDMVLVAASGAPERLYAIDPTADAADIAVRAFAPTEVAPPMEAALVRGRLASTCGDVGNVRVRVGDIETRSGADGRYEVALTAGGAVAIVVGDPAPAAPSWPTGEVELVGHRRYNAGVLQMRCPA